MVFERPDGFQDGSLVRETFKNGLLFESDWLDHKKQPTIIEIYSYDRDGMPIKIENYHQSEEMREIHKITTFFYKNNALVSSRETASDGSYDILQTYDAYENLVSVKDGKSSEYTYKYKIDSYDNWIESYSPSDLLFTRKITYY
ncbi:hypothetical protein GCM10008938_23480 [Deinococcus roseus]|uniref:Uncharacterized protein n=2 Tax=Deinococcus roseus TaxID=392414 RepID=A0ABQ2D078_9DEIO|nr:hypothetical protein GCM10008938_23480 [Deinococcus roseus]